MALAAFDPQTLPVFSKIDPLTITTEIKKRLDKDRETIKKLLENKDGYTWDNLMAPMEIMNDDLNKYWSPIGHLNGVLQSDTLRDAYNKSVEMLTAYHTELSQNEALYQAIESIKARDDFANLTKEQQKIINNEIRDFKLAGIHLPAEKKARLAELKLNLSKACNKFSDNLLDATNAWSLHVTDESKLAGLPDQAVQLAADNAKQRKLDGYVFTLEYPSFSTAIRYLKDRDLREQIYTAYATRASDQGPDANKWDNSPVIEEIMQLRTEIANIVGFKNYAELSLAPKMAQSTTQVMEFLDDLAFRSKDVAKEELNEISSLAKQDGVEKIETWDIQYYSHLLEKQKFNFSQEDLRPYFPIDKVMQGMFNIINKLYGITIKEEKVDVWHPQVQFFTLYDEDNQFRAGFYTDLYARPNKRGGAWMDECIVRYMSDGKMQYPIAYLTCNFMRPVSGKPALLTHEDVLTLFHEFGHCLHHMLTKVNTPSVSGINGVPWDAVEFPSQFMENFCWDIETINMFAEHYETKASFPEDLYQKMLASKTFLAGMQMLRQLEFSIFDFRLHMEYDPDRPYAQVQELLDDVRTTIAVSNPPAFNRFQHSFSHIFAGGYAAGYYSYKWAEVLSADAFSAFEENGLLDAKTGRRFLTNILEVGGVPEPMDAFVAFRGRKPDIAALLKHNGITYSEESPR